MTYITFRTRHKSLAVPARFAPAIRRYLGGDAHGYLFSHEAKLVAQLPGAFYCPR